MNIFQILLLVITVGVVHASGSTATPTSEDFACPVSSPVDSRPVRAINPFDDNASLYYEDGLWVEIPEDGVIALSPDDEITFGPLEGWRSLTVTWLREEGVEGFVEVTGERLDAESELTPQTPLSPQRQYVRIGPVRTGLAFPSTGCWEVVGSAGKNEITFVVEVRFVEQADTRE